MLVKVGPRSDYPAFYNSVISKRIYNKLYKLIILNGIPGQQHEQQIQLKETLKSIWYKQKPRLLLRMLMDNKL